jgi:hypothetical protein
MRNSQVTKFQGCARFWSFCFVLHSGNRILTCLMDLLVKICTLMIEIKTLYAKKKKNRHTGDFFRSYRRNHVPWGRISLWKWVPGFILGVKTAGAWGWRPTTLVVPNVKKSAALTYPEPPWAFSDCQWAWPLPLSQGIFTCRLYQTDFTVSAPATDNR